MISGHFRRASLDAAHTTTMRCRAGKGFGGSSAKPKGAGSKPGVSNTPEQAAERALAEASRGRPKVRPIDPREAARGKVDYVQVKDWANGQAGDLGELQMVPGSLGTGFTTGGSTDTAAAAAAAAADTAVPFFQQLGQHAQYLERQGALSIAEERNAKPYLPFEAWQYSVQRYRQYLAEVAALHLALEAALQLALSAPAVPAAAPAASLQRVDLPTTSSSSSSSSSSGVSSVDAGWAVSGREGQVLQAYAALECFGRGSGLWRAAAAHADLQALSSTQHGSSPAPQHNKHRANSAAPDIHPSQNAVAYGKYLLQLGRAAAAATEAAATAAAAAAGSSSDDSLVAEEAAGAAAALKLLAHAYALQVQQQCLGTRIGAAATDKLQLLPARAVALYMDYPSTVVGEPVQQLVRITDTAGQKLDAAGRQAVLQELPKALKKSALMLAPLATAE